ncbi:MAG TPA: TIGR03435 family protein [Bryobacteraceae bacterium]|jgi:uncharacterized protein (TIGR03435 family)|nr:TIGR03435 family protein [Bryobacteraceae bacterium]
MLRIVSLAALVLALAPLMCAQPTPVDPKTKFEVDTVKLSGPLVPGTPCGIRPQPGGQVYAAQCLPVKVMLTAIYRLKPDQIIGGPAWLDSERYDVRGKAEKSSDGEDLHTMFKNLLADRFKLQVHFEKKAMSVYGLTVDKAGPKIKPHEASNGGDPWIDQAQSPFLHFKLTATFCPMEYFAWRLGQLVDRPIADMTNLKGGYDFTLEYTADLPPNIPENAQINGAPIDTSGPNIFTAVRQQLGLRLEPQKAPVQVMVIDHVEKPSGDN